jgi:3-deoxy-D-manno-octulosonic-acid transferase
VSYLLNLVYLVLLLGALPWLIYQAIRKGKYREGFRAKFLGLVPRRESQGPCVWLHAVSVGEVNVLQTLVDRIARQRPEWECVVSTTTMTGMALAQKKYPESTVFYCPLDFSWAVRSAMRRVRPQVLVLAELELWPNLVRSARDSGARVALINGRLSESSYRGYRRIRPLAASVLSRIDLVAAQDETYAGRFLDLGADPESVHVTGSLKYDGAETDRCNPTTERLRRLAGFSDEDIVFLAGSTQDPEERYAIGTFRELRNAWPRLRLVLVPRHPDRFDSVARLLDQSDIPWQRRTDLEKNGPDPQARILLVDAIGELGAWWGTAQIAFVGGSMGTRGGQNMIEPAAYGAAVSFGPNTRNFRDIVATMLSREAAIVVKDAVELTEFARRCLEEPGYATALGARAQDLVRSQLGATERTYRLLEPLIGKPPISRPMRPNFAGKTSGHPSRRS